MVLVTCDLQLLLQARFAVDSFKRLGLVCGLAAASYLCLTSDINSRWSATLANQYLTADNPDVKGWMPDKGGIFYSADMTLFYQTFSRTRTATGATCSALSRRGCRRRISRFITRYCGISATPKLRAVGGKNAA